MSQALSILPQLTSPSRLRAAIPLPGSLSAWEVAVLAMAGAIAGASVGLVELRLQIPGHSILHTVLPMTLGLAAVPRRYAGTGMSLSAAVTAGGVMVTGRGEFGAGAWTSLVCMGPILDIMLWSRLGKRWPAFSVAIAGMMANLFAFAAKAAEKWAARVPLTNGRGMGGGGGRGLGMGGGMGLGGGNGMGGGHGMGMGGGRGLGGGGGLGQGRSWDDWISVAPYSYIVCGLLAGLLCGLVLFHLRQKSAPLVEGDHPVSL